MEYYPGVHSSIRSMGFNLFGNMDWAKQPASIPDVGTEIPGCWFDFTEWCSWKRESLPDKNSIFRSALCGVLMLLGGIVSVVWAEQYLSSSLAAIVVTLLPFWFILLDKKQWSFYFSNKSIIVGLLLGFAGVDSSWLSAILRCCETSSGKSTSRYPGHIMRRNRMDCRISLFEI